MISDATNTLLDNVFYLDKSRDAAATKRHLRNTIHRVGQLSPEDRQELMEWLHDVLLRLVPEREFVNELLSTFRKGDENEMEYALERVFREEQKQWLNEGRIKGLNEGRTEGRNEGRREKQKEIALRMLRRGMPLPDIQEITELSRGDLETLQKGM